MAEVKIGMTIEEASEYTGIGRNTMRKLVEWRIWNRKNVQGRTVLCIGNTMRNMYGADK